MMMKLAQTTLLHIIERKAMGEPAKVLRSVLANTYNHHRVNHSAGEYVRSFCLHTNGIESVWALFKRQIIGTHHYLSPKHLNRYLGEVTWRFNRRAFGEGDRVNALLDQVSGRLTYKELIA